MPMKLLPRSSPSTVLALCSVIVVLGITLVLSKDSSGLTESANAMEKPVRESEQIASKCGTPEVPPKVLAKLAAEWRAAKSKDFTIPTTTIPVHFVHVVNGSAGSVTEQQRVEQVAILNAAFAFRGFEFCYDPEGAYPPEIADNSVWFKMNNGSISEKACKQAYNKSSDRVLNFYTCDPLDAGLSGWASFPFPVDDNPVDPQLDGITVRYTTLPGDSAVHEVGHWLGLFHTFQNTSTCPERNSDSEGDLCVDTQAHQFQDNGCPDRGPSCDDGESSPIHNYMNYTSDACRNEFTSGQGNRMSFIVAQYRPNLGAGTCESCALVRLSGALKTILPFPLSQDDMDGLRKFRDVVLNKSEAGRVLSTLYYQHGPKIAELMLRNPQLAGETLSYLAKHMPAVERAVERDGAVHFVQKDYDHGMRLLDRYRKIAPADLVRTLTRVEALIEEAVKPGNDVVTIKFSSAPNIASSAMLTPIPDPISAKTN